MAYDQGVTPVTIPASADLSTKQFQFVSVNSSGQLAVTGDGLAADGVLLDKPNAQAIPGNIASIPGQVTRVILGTGGATAGDLLEVASGKAITKVSGKILAKALTTGIAGDIIPALLILQR